ncbi:hypothetical protein SAMN05216480_102266 [Pustulibacterium marinum]|uniref:Inner membrane protein YedI n=1 Tax=Pustulibacterium marinum TaxID=1224947 RepID=A0A1I7FVB3_9FLAO|nr:DUF808 family protein [Pustulibacterium marinum]SFU40091.1 hypothetical protein SAMN05216480_102266 [Pustulibacterium marinum]
MASGFFAILDDIASLMDDVASASKIATQKTAGILGDDLAVNAEKATGFVSSRELPVLWSISKGALLNKIIIIPIVFLLKVYVPIAITIVLLIGGFYLAYEGVEKIVEFLFHKQHKPEAAAIPKGKEAALAAEKSKIKAAISTDFILSLEIVIIALASVPQDATLGVQIVTVTVVALLATVGIYGIVALIVRMDDAGIKLIDRSNDTGFRSKLGHFLVRALPVVIRILSVVGTIALILVSGGIFVHNVEYIHHMLPSVPSIVKEIALGLIAGLIALGVITGVKKLIHVFKK